MNESKAIPYLVRWFLPVYCRRCGEVLTSPRSRKKGIGQRCWREERGLPPLPYQRTNNDDEFKYSGSKTYVQMRIDDF